MNDKLGGLQAARAVAALSIAYFHSWVALLAFPKDTAFPIYVLANYGWIAVDFFFAISGFVICLVVDRAGVNPLSFLVKRVFRLYPLWLVMLTAWAGLCYLWRGFAPEQTMGHFFYSATLLLTKEYPFYELGWSLQHEMVFYVLAALVVPVLGVAGLAGALIVSSLVGILFDLPWYLETLARYHPNFLAGVLAFTFRERLRPAGVVPLLATGLACLLIAGMYLGRPYYPIGLFFALCGFVNMQNTQVARPIVALGDASYSIYLVHPIVFYMALTLTSRIGPLPLWWQEPIRLTCFAVVIATSLATWRLLEMRMIRLGNDVAGLLSATRPAPAVA